jgi:flagellar hook-associated protein 2
MSDSTTIFAGSSRYSNDFQQVIERAVKIASLPLTQLQSQRTTLTDRSSALSTLASDFSAISAAISGVEMATGTSSFAAVVSNESVAHVTLAKGVDQGDYSVDVLNAGAYSTGMSTDGLAVVGDPSSENISTSATFALTVNGQTFQLTPASNSLFSLVGSINAANAGVRATLINVGGSTHPDYRLTLRSEKLANVAVQLNDGSADLLNVLTTGAPLTYRINGQPATPISSDTRTVTISPGVNVELKAPGTANITIGRSGSAAKDAITKLVTSFNTAVEELDKHRGTNAGALAGDSLLTELTHSLREISGYQSGTGAIRSLSEIGVSLDKYGKLSFSESAFDAKISEDPNAVFDFLGTTTSAGFLKSTYEKLNEASESSNSVLQLAKTSLSQQITNQDKLIAENQARVDDLRERLQAQMAAADALIANLEQQVKMIENLFQSQQSNNG